MAYLIANCSLRLLETKLGQRTKECSLAFDDASLPHAYSFSPPLPCDTLQVSPSHTLGKIEVVPLVA